MIIAINGSQFITEDFARELILDWLKEGSILVFMAPEQDKDPDGLCNAWETVEDLELDDKAVIELWDDFSEFTDQADDKYFFCLGVAGIEDDINICLELGIPVLDLSRALYPITERVEKEKS